MSELETGALGAGRIEPRELEQEMRSSYLDYAMSVIVGRALPDVRDGLKPVHRRVLYSMWTNGNRAGRPLVKSARIVGDVMGKFHPHCDQAIYDSTTGKITATGHVVYDGGTHSDHLVGTHATYDVSRDTGTSTM